MKLFNSPKVLIEAAASPPQELPPVGMRPDKVHVARPWGYKGTMVKPDDWHSREARPVITPNHWKCLSLVKRGDGYCLLSFATQTALLKADLRILGIPTSTPTYRLEYEEALRLGDQIEKAFERKLRPPQVKKKKPRMIPLDAEQAEWEKKQLEELYNQANEL